MEIYWAEAQAWWQAAEYAQPETDLQEVPARDRGAATMKGNTIMMNDLFDALAEKLAAINPDRLDAEAQLEKLHEELDELVEEVRATGGAIQAEKVLAEAADVVIVATMIGRAFGHDWNDLVDAVEAKMNRNVRRTWAAHNGTARHV